MKNFNGNTITSKPLKLYPDTNLYYEKDQHLTFLFQSEIEYEPDVIQSISSMINDSCLIFDIVCNIGQFMLLFSKMATKGYVYSFEPDPKNYAFACFNKQMNSLNNVSISNVGISDN